jgi:hypothetical protein
MSKIEPKRVTPASIITITNAEIALVSHHFPEI